MALVENDDLLTYSLTQCFTVSGRTFVVLLEEIVSAAVSEHNCCSKVTLTLANKTKHSNFQEPRPRCHCFYRKRKEFTMSAPKDAELLVKLIEAMTRQQGQSDGTDSHDDAEDP
jgi:hypothetical protein